MKKLGLKKYLIFTKSGFQVTIAYRGQIALWFLGGVISAVLTGLLWWAIFKANAAEGVAFDSPENLVGGYTFAQMLMYVVLSSVVVELVYAAQSMGEITDDVRWGFIGMRLMKPISYRAQLAFSSVGHFAARFLIIGVPLTAAGALTMVFGFGLTGIEWYNVLLFVLACFAALLIKDAVEFLFGQLAFYTQAMFGVNSIMQVLIEFLSGACVPLALFPAWAQTALSYTPFPSMISVPVRLFMGMMDWRETLIAFAVSIAWIIALNALGALLYKTSVRKVVVFGG